MRALVTPAALLLLLLPASAGAIARARAKSAAKRSVARRGAPKRTAPKRAAPRRPVARRAAAVRPASRRPAARRAATKTPRKAASGARTGPTARRARTRGRPTVAFQGRAKVVTAVLNLRAAPSKKARDIGDVPRGTKLTLVARTKHRYREDDTGASYWFKTSFQGKTGWLWGGYLAVHVVKPPRPPSQTFGRPTQWIKGLAYSMLNGLNLRAGPTTRSRDLGDIAFGQKLRIHARTRERYPEDNRGKYRWYEVSFAKKRGWVFGAYLRFHSPPPRPGGGDAPGYPGYFAPRGRKLARAAYQRGTTHPTVGWCLKGVEEALASSILGGHRFWINSAHDFGVYAEGAGRAPLARLGLRVDATPPGRSASFPKGTVMIFSRGRCGFNAKWGHIEVVVDRDTACSDHCRRRNDEWCGPSTIFYPTRK